MRVLGVMALVVTAGALYAAGSVAAAPSAGFFNCGNTNRIAGHTWGIRTVGVSCGTARSVVRQLANRTVPSTVQKIGRFPGTYSGMRCLGALPGQKPKSIGCSKISGRGIVTAARLR